MPRVAKKVEMLQVSLNDQRIIYVLWFHFLELHSEDSEVRLPKDHSRIFFGLPFHLGVSVVSDVQEMRGDTLPRWFMF